MKKLFSQIPYLKGKKVTLRALTPDDAEDLGAMTGDEEIYRNLPTFLFEKKYDDPAYVIRHLYDECIEESLILGVFLDEEFCGLAELYAYRPPIRKISVGVRLIKKFWGAGVASMASEMIVDYLMNETDIELITAVTMTRNKAAGNVLKKQGFKRVAHGVYENWGFDSPTPEDVWVRTRAGYRKQRRKD